MKPTAATLGAIVLIAISGHTSFAGTTSAHATVCVPTLAGPNGPRWMFNQGTGGTGGSPPALTYNSYGVQLDDGGTAPAQTFVCPVSSSEGGNITGATALVADRNETLNQDVSCTFTISSLTNGAPIYSISMSTSGWMASTQTFFLSVYTPAPGSSVFTCKVPPKSTANGFSNLGAFTVTRS